MIETTKKRYRTTEIAGSNRPKTLYRYYVTGRGDFPFDMLRYDCAWPADSHGAMAIGYTDDPNRMKCIPMHSYSAPTIARWLSFGWSVGLENLR